MTEGNNIFSYRVYVPKAFTSKTTKKTSREKWRIKIYHVTYLKDLKLL
jgi:hypothetical protein